MSLLTSSEAAQALRTSPRQITILCAKGLLRASKPGRQWLISEADLDAYVSDHENRKPRKRRKRNAA